MKNSYRNAILYYKYREPIGDEDHNRTQIMFDNGFANFCFAEKGDEFIQTVTGKDQIHNKVRFNALVIFGANNGQEVYHVLKHKSLMQNVNKILVIWDDTDDIFNHRHWATNIKLNDYNGSKYSLYTRKNI